MKVGLKVNQSVYNFFNLLILMEPAMEDPTYNADKLSDRTSEISPNGGLQRWFFGLFAALTLLVGLLVASRDAESPAYTVGLLIAAAALACIVYTINAGFGRRH